MHADYLDRLAITACDNSYCCAVLMYVYYIFIFHTLPHKLKIDFDGRINARFEICYGFYVIF